MYICTYTPLVIVICCALELVFQFSKLNLTRKYELKEIKVIFIGWDHKHKDWTKNFCINALQSLKHMLKRGTAHLALYGPYNVWTREVWAFGGVNGAIPLVVPRRVPVQDTESGVGGVRESTVTEFTSTPNYRSTQMQLYSLLILLNSDRLKCRVNHAYSDVLKTNNLDSYKCNSVLFIW